MNDENIVKVYIGNISSLNDDDFFYKAYESVSDYRKNKIDSVRFLEDKQRSLGAGLLLKKALEDVGISEKKVEFITKENGKPHIKEMENFCFNLSHSGDYVVCAVSDKEIGCDIEFIKNIDLCIADRFFHKKEAEIIKKQSTNEQKLDLFYRIWTLKESFIKATGKGLSEDLQSFFFKFIDDDFENAVLFLDNSFDISTNPNPIENFCFKQFFIDEKYKFSLCCNSKIEKIDIVSIKDFHYI